MDGGYAGTFLEYMIKFVVLRACTNWPRVMRKNRIEVDDCAALIAKQF